MQANAHSRSGTVRGTVLLNCAGGMNTKVGAVHVALAKLLPLLTAAAACRCTICLLQGLTDDWRVRLAFPFFRLIDFLLSRQRIARYLFDNFRTKDNLKNVLKVCCSTVLSR